MARRKATTRKVRSNLSPPTRMTAEEESRRGREIATTSRKLQRQFEEQCGLQRGLIRASRQEDVQAIQPRLVVTLRLNPDSLAQFGDDDTEPTRVEPSQAEPAKQTLTAATITIPDALTPFNETRSNLEIVLFFLRGPMGEEQREIALRHAELAWEGTDLAMFRVLQMESRLAGSSGRG